MPIKSKQGKGDNNKSVEEEKKSALEPKHDKQSKGEVLETLSDCSAEVPSEGAAETSFLEGQKKEPNSPAILFDPQNYVEHYKSNL